MKRVVHRTLSADRLQTQVSGLVTATTASGAEHPLALDRARAFAAPLIEGETLESGENTLLHADAVASIVKTMGGSEAMQAGSYLVHACAHLNRPYDVIANAFGASFADLAVETTKLMRVQKQARSADAAPRLGEDIAQQIENIRKMLLSFSRDLRVVMLCLASRLQALRFLAASKRTAPAALAQESLQVFAPLANRLGIWQVKWEIEDLAFRFLEPQTYHSVARMLDEKRAERESHLEQARARLQEDLHRLGIEAFVQGRPKHIYSIVKKMQGKSLDFDQVLDLRALRVVVPTLNDCYAALSWVHSSLAPVVEEFDDYIARPKSNGYQSLHTIVRDAAGKAIEIQIRTEAMHEHAEHGVAAHWAYKEAGTKGYAGVKAAGEYDTKIAVLRQLLAWERDLTGEAHDGRLFDNRIYVLTPDAAVIELPCGATPVDFAYSVHTHVGHRCRGARIDHQMVPLNTPLKNGQTVEIVTIREGGPSRDWLNAELGFLVSHRARAKVRAWFNAQATQETVARGREAVEKLLQREGRTAVRLDELALRLGFKSANGLFEGVGKDEFSLRNIKVLLRPSDPSPDPDALVLTRRGATGHRAANGGVLVVGVDSLMTQLARCCKPAPPDPIGGFITRGSGVSVHRLECHHFREMSFRSPERVIDVDWGTPKSDLASVYPSDVIIDAADRQGLLRDISEVFSKEKINVIGVQTHSSKGRAWMTFTVEVVNAHRLGKALAAIGAVEGVGTARRR